MTPEQKHDITDPLEMEKVADALPMFGLRASADRARPYSDYHEYRGRLT
ncbi:hypothetical protein [Nocardia salmonicida]